MRTWIFVFDRHYDDNLLWKKKNESYDIIEIAPNIYHFNFHPSIESGFVVSIYFNNVKKGDMNYERKKIHLWNLCRKMPIEGVKEQDLYRIEYCKCE